MSFFSITISVSLVMFLAELGDKTNLVALSLMGKTKKPYTVALGGLVGIVITTLVGVFIGYFLGSILPMWVIPFVAGFVFIFLGLSELLGNDESDEQQNGELMENNFSYVFKRSLLLVMFAEFGDKSQLFVISGTTLSNPYAVFTGAIIGMGVVMLITAIFGDKFLLKIPEEKLHLVASLLFIFAGLWIIISAGIDLVNINNV